jgi:hypothetical protein
MAVGLPGRFPTSTARCFTFSGCRRASCSAEGAPAEKPMTSIWPMSRASSRAANASAWVAGVAFGGMLEPR